jgi:hypothetical protein
MVNDIVPSTGALRNPKSAMVYIINYRSNIELVAALGIIETKRR